MKLIVIGGVAAGASSAVKARRASEDWEIVIYEKGDYISYANCGMPYYIGDTIKDRDQLLVVTPAYLKNRFNVDVKTKHEVIKIIPDKKAILVKNLLTGESFEDFYDKLVIATGATPIIPDTLKGERVFTLYTMNDMDRLKGFINIEKPKKALIMGAGFIGIELAENLLNLGLEVTIIEKMEQILPPFDPEMANMVLKNLNHFGINVITGIGAKSVEGNNIYLENGQTISFDFAVASLGVKPNSSIVEGTDIQLGLRNSIKVNKFMETSIKDIYAAGDVAENYYKINNEPTWIPLAGSANKQGRIAGYNAVLGNKKEYKGTLGTAIAKFKNCVFAVTGFNEKKLQQDGYDYISFYLTSQDHAEYYPGAKPMVIKVLGDRKGRILGAQIVGESGVDKRIDVFASAIYSGLTFEDLESLDLAYAPPFSSAKDPVIIAGMIGNNIIKGEAPTLSKLPKDIDGVTILDVRTVKEFSMGSYRNAINIPLNELRKRINELENMKNQQIIISCATGHRSYVATRMLLNKDFSNVVNLSGGYQMHGKRDE
ncbi:MAG: FAD-dependent oxidoreductase [Proteobacteria bacterium]|nr:FAD-dependent oxidoreductase [Pseudomonadota bacterium]